MAGAVDLASGLEAVGLTGLEKVRRPTWEDDVFTEPVSLRRVEIQFGPVIAEIERITFLDCCTTTLPIRSMSTLRIFLQQCLKWQPGGTLSQAPISNMVCAPNHATHIAQ